MLSRGGRRPGGLLALLLACAVALVAAPGVPAQAADAGKLVLVLDSSGSMKQRVGGDTKIAIAKKALGTVVDHLPAGAQVGLRVYGATVENRADKGACTDSQLVVPIGTGNRPALKDEIRRYKPYGETPISYSLGQAAKDLGDTGPRTVVLVSDGEETCDADPCATAEKLAAKGIDLKFDVIGLRVSGRARSQLQCVADRGNGTYYDADNAEQVEDSLDKLATRAFRPFKLTGTPIEGSTREAGAPVASPGQYVDTFPGRKGMLHYRLPRTAAGSTLHVGVTTEAAGFVPGLHVELGLDDGTPCGSGLGMVANVGGTRTVLTSAASSWKSDEASPCGTAAELLLTVEASDVELAGRRFEVVVREEPPLANSRHLDPTETTIRWVKMSPDRTRARPPVPGTTISDSPVLAPGTYSTSILTGEKQVYAVDLDWGQRLQVQTVVAPRRGALARALGVSDSMNVQLLGTMRGEYDALRVSGKPVDSNTMLEDDEPYRLSATTATIRYLNRGSFALSPGAIPGPQYVVVSKSRVASEGQFLVPYTLVVKVLGTAGTGAPEYVSATPTPSPTPVPTPSPGSSAPATPPASSGVPALAAVGIGVGALVAGALGAAAVLARRRRRGAHGSGGPGDSS